MLAKIMSETRVSLCCTVDGVLCLTKHFALDHLALNMELLGRMPSHLAADGKYASELFQADGTLRCAAYGSI